MYVRIRVFSAQHKDRIFNRESSIIYLFYNSLRKIFQNIGFLWPLFSCIRTESSIQNLQYFFFFLNAIREIFQSMGFLWPVFSRIKKNVRPVQSNNRNTKKFCEKCSKLTIKIVEQRHWCYYGVLIVDFECISQLFLVFPLLTLSG